MSDSGESTRILNAESRDVLSKAREAELAKILKLRLILTQLRRLRTKNLDLPGSEEVEYAIRLLTTRNYLRINKENNDCLLNLNYVPSGNISYSERKAVRQRLIKKLQATYQTVANFKMKMREEFPELFVPCNTSINTSATTSQVLNSFSSQLCELEAQRYKNSLALVETQNRKCSLMKVAADLKIGPYQSHSLELLCTDLRISHAKATLMRSHIIDNLLECSDRCNEAFKKVEESIELSLDSIDE